MTPRYKIVFAGQPVPALIRWLQALIPVLREVPHGVEVQVTITTADRARRDEAA